MGVTPQGQEIWYRYEETHYASTLDEYGSSNGDGSTTVRLVELPVVRHTPKGVWIALNYSMQEKFVLVEANKRYACPTIWEARESFIARKRRQIRIHSAVIRKVERAIAVLDSGQIDHHMWAWYPEDFERHMRQKKGYVAVCGTCYDTGMILECTPRPGPVPGNQRVGCPDCEPGRKIRADEEEAWRKIQDELNNSWTPEKIKAFDEIVSKEKEQAQP